MGKPISPTKCQKKHPNPPCRALTCCMAPLLLKILWFSLPLAASSLLEQLFNSVDIAVVGHFVGSNALAAVGSNAPVIGLLINLFMGISMGANAVISTLIGQRDYTRIRHAVSTVAVVALVSGFVLTVLGTSLARPILSAMSTPPEVLDMAILYLRIYFLGMPFFMIYVFGAAILRSKGDTRRPLYILFVAGIANTLLNLLFVLVFHMGVEGVAISTSIANALSAYLMVRLLRREEVPFRLDFHDLHVDRRELLRMLKIGVPAGLQGMVFSVSNVVVQSQINTFGADAVAGSSAALNFEYYCYFIIQAFNGAAISFIAQNYGAGLMQRVRRVFLDMYGRQRNILWDDERYFRLLLPLLPSHLLLLRGHHSLWCDTHAPRLSLPVVGLQLRDFRFRPARNGAFAPSRPPHGCRHLPAPHAVGLRRLPRLAWLPSAHAGLSALLGADRRHGCRRLRPFYEKKSRGRTACCAINKW